MNETDCIGFSFMIVPLSKIKYSIPIISSKSIWQNLKEAFGGCSFMMNCARNVKWLYALDALMMSMLLGESVTIKSKTYVLAGCNGRI